MDPHLSAGGHISQAPNDRRESVPALNSLDELPEAVGDPERIAANSGYYSEKNIDQITERDTIPYLATGRQPHNPRWDERRVDPGPVPEQATEAEQIGWPPDRGFNGCRKATVETVFGIIKHAIRFRQFMLRGAHKVAGE